MAIIWLCEPEWRAVDRDGNIILASSSNDSNNNTQIMQYLVWMERPRQIEQVTNFNYINTSDAYMDGSMSRPLIACTRYGKTYILPNKQRWNGRSGLRVIDVTKCKAPREFILAV